MDEEVVTTWTHLSMTGKNRRDGKDFQRGPKMNLKKCHLYIIQDFFYVHIRLCTKLEKKLLTKVKLFLPGVFYASFN